MKGVLCRYIGLVCYTLLLVAITSCNDEHDDIPYLNDSVWIHQFSPEDNIVDAAGAALCFGKKQVEYFAIASNGKVLRLFDSFDYHLKNDQIIVIGKKEYMITDHTLMFSNKMFYRTDKRFDEMVLRK